MIRPGPHESLSRIMQWMWGKKYYRRTCGLCRTGVSDTRTASTRCYV